MTLFEKWKRAARHRFKMSYKRTLQIEREKMQKEIDALKDQHRKNLIDLHRGHTRELEQERARSTAIAKEVTRLRLEYGPEQFGTRFTLYATVGEHFTMYARDLKDHMSYIVEILAAQIKREFAQIDFSRIKPIDPGPRPTKYPRFSIEPREEGYL